MNRKSGDVDVRFLMTVARLHAQGADPGAYARQVAMSYGGDRDAGIPHAVWWLLEVKKIPPLRVPVLLADYVEIRPEDVEPLALAHVVRVKQTYNLDLPFDPVRPITEY